MNARDNQQNNCGKKQTLAGAAMASCQKLIAQIEQVKSRLVEEFGAQLAGHESMLKLVLNEAEALAWETRYPQLVFATLAAEKAEAIATWEKRRQSICRPVPAFAGVDR
jgi:hypothetical protein